MNSRIILSVLFVLSVFILGCSNPSGEAGYLLNNAANGGSVLAKSAATNYDTFSEGATIPSLLGNGYYAGKQMKIHV